MSSTNGLSGWLKIKEKGDMTLGWVLEVGGGQEVGKGRGEEQIWSKFIRYMYEILNKKNFKQANMLPLKKIIQKNIS